MIVAGAVMAAAAAVAAAIMGLVSDMFELWRGEP